MIGETINTVTKVAMVICFSGVALIACSPYILDASSDDDDVIAERELPYGLTSAGVANLLGCVLILGNAICQGLVGVATRMMQKMNWSVILFYYSLVALITISVIYAATAGPAGEISRIFNYSWEQMGWIAITAGFNMVALISKTISN